VEHPRHRPRTTLVLLPCRSKTTTAWTSPPSRQSSTISRRRRIPILAVIGVVGTTEEGAIDEIPRDRPPAAIAARTRGISFYIHVDARAYGGYAAIPLPRRDGTARFSGLHEVSRPNMRGGRSPRDTDWLTADVYEPSGLNAGSGFDHRGLRTMLATFPTRRAPSWPGTARIVAMISYFARLRLREDRRQHSMLLAATSWRDPKSGAARAAGGLGSRTGWCRLDITVYGRTHRAQHRRGNTAISAGPCLPTIPILIDGPAVRGSSPWHGPTCNIVDYAFHRRANRQPGAGMNDLEHRRFSSSAPTRTARCTPATSSRRKRR
jgi:hypothetical protein